MSKQVAHLPPRCPFQKKPVSHSVYNPISPSPCHGNESYPRHHKSSSQSSILDEQPAWLDDLLSDPNSLSKVTLHRRSASDSVTLSGGLGDSFSGTSSLNEEDGLVVSNGNGSGSVLESNCIYGPNSPRHKGNLTFSEKAIASALSEYASQESLQYLDGGLNFSGITHSDSRGAACCEVGELNTELKPAKRHAGQRSRVRKIQYIAELEKTVNVYENLETELSMRVASLLQERVALSLENSRLKQQVARIQHEKLIMEGEYQFLKKEAERLKSGLANSKVRRYLGATSAVRTNRSEAAWQMLDIAKLGLNSN